MSSLEFNSPTELNPEKSPPDKILHPQQLTISRWGDVYEYVSNEFETSKEWHIDSNGGLIYPESAFPIWDPTATHLKLGEVPPAGTVLSAQDGPGIAPYDDSDGAYRIKYLQQEFETYVICLEGIEGLQVDELRNWAGYIRTLESVTVYGGVKWRHEFQFNEGDQTYAEIRDITDVIGRPSERLKEALESFFYKEVPYFNFVP